MTRLVALMLMAAGGVLGQSGAAPEWKEFSIGPATRAQGRFGADGIRGTGVPLKRILSKAYGLPEHRIVGPVWMAQERYALTAIVSNPDDFAALMQRELAARFQLVAHREKKEIPVYVLIAVEGKELAAQDGAGGRRGLGTAKPGGLSRMSTASGSPVGNTLTMPESTLSRFAETLADMVGRPVFEETGIAGAFDITLNWKLGNTASLKAAVKEQLGLELVDEKRTVELLIVERIERPQFSQ